jgi:hypothetical protein
VRGSRPTLLCVAAGLGVLAAGSLGGKATGACARPFSCGAGSLPAPIVITTGRVSFRIARDGRAARVPTPPDPLPEGAALFPASGTWFTIRRDHLVVGRGSTRLWRSRGGKFSSRYGIGVIVAGPRAVAFQHDHKLWIAPLDGAERPVAARELPLGWTTAGLYIYRYRGRQLLLRSDRGALLEVIARQPLGSDYFVSGGDLYFIVHGVLMSASGAHVRRLASLRGLGVSEDSWLQPVGWMLELEDNSRVVVVRADGSIFASIRLREWRAGGLSSSLVPAPDGSAVAFTATSGRTHATETVYLARAGARTATALHREAVELGGCEQGASVQWLGRWLLYSDTDGKLAAIDTAGGRRVLDLTRLVGRLPGIRNPFTVYWSGRSPEL